MLGKFNADLAAWQYEWNDIWAVLLNVHRQHCEQGPSRGWKDGRELKQQQGFNPQISVNLPNTAEKRNLLASQVEGSREW